MILSEKLPRLMLYLIVMNLILGSSCGQKINQEIESQEISEATNTDSTFPSLPEYVREIPPVQARDWNSLIINTLCMKQEITVEVVEEIPDSLNIGESVQSLLNNMGIEVVQQTGGTCDAALDISVTAIPFDAFYLPGGQCYTGARVEVSLSLSSQDLPPIEDGFINSKSPPQSITTCPTAKNAPFSNLWVTELLEILEKIWGPRIYVSGLRTEKFNRYSYAPLSITMPTEEIISSLIINLTEPETSVAGSLVEVNLLSLWDAYAAIPYIRTNLQNPELPWYIHMDCVEALYQMDALDPEDIPFLVNLLLIEGGNKGDNTRIAYYLGRIEPVEPVLEALSQLLTEDDETVRVYAVSGFLAVGASGAEYVIPLFNDPSAAVQEEAVIMLGSMGPEIIPSILSFMQSNDSNGELAASVLANISGNDFGTNSETWQTWWVEMETLMEGLDGAPQLSEALNHAERVIHLYALEQLPAYGPDVQQALPFLAQQFDEGGLFGRVGFEALTAMGKESLPLLIPRISSEDYDGRTNYFVYDILRNIGPQAREAVPYLIAELHRYDVTNTKSGYGTFFYYIVKALNSITGESFGGNANTWQNWWNSQ